MLDCRKIEEYAVEIVNRLGEDHYSRDPTFGGTEYDGSSYCGYGFEIRCYGKGVSSIRYDGECVYAGKREWKRSPNGWELVLQELHAAIPKILAERRRRREQQEKDDDFIAWCRIFADEGYEDDLVKLDNRHGGLKIYKKRKNRILFWRYDYELVYGREGREVHNLPSDSLWRRHLESKIAERKMRNEERRKRREEEERKRKAEAWAARPKPNDYIDQLRKL